jgi:dihydropteroate synthase
MHCYALKVRFSDSGLLTGYRHYYDLSGLPVRELTGYELIGTDGNSESTKKVLQGGQYFRQPRTAYIPGVIGLLLAHDQNHFEELTAGSGLNIQNLDCLKGAWRSGKRSQPKLMGIINTTPDSFSDGGKHLSVQAAVDTAGEMVEAGMHILDIGGESTRPGSERLSAELELERVIPVIEQLRRFFPSVSISIDTYKSSVAEAAARAGAVMINDIGGGTFDPNIFTVAAKYKTAYIAMHTPGDPKIMQINPNYTNLIPEIAVFLLGQAQKARNAGVEQIILDPGIGFGKTVENNFELLRSIHSFSSFGFPVLIGLSRKSFIGKSLNLDVADRDTATAILNFHAMQCGAAIIRTHNLEFAKQTSILYQHLNGLHG